MSFFSLKPKFLIHKFIVISILSVLLTSILPYNTAKADDAFSSMSELMENTTEGSDWQITTTDRGSDVLIAVIHGGGIEPATSQLASLIASNGGYNYYSFQGVRPTNNGELHVTSTNYDEPIVQHMQYTANRSVTIHGALGTEPVTYIGGKDQSLITRIEDELRNAGFEVQESPNHLSGSSDNNIVNKNQRGEGVQLELTTAMRQSLFSNNDISKISRMNLLNYNADMYNYAHAVNDAIAKDN